MPEELTGSKLRIQAAPLDSLSPAGQTPGS
jgi:hypothetical protein